MGTCVSGKAFLVVTLDPSVIPSESNFRLLAYKRFPFTTMNQTFCLKYGLIYYLKYLWESM